ncbi:MAG: 50S ribosomal protein L21e [Candidatus Brockarchaeota archaeon]|nr:50S ribosomal protein L21e [Candidatus Brockarchaeota archaeon]
MPRSHGYRRSSRQLMKKKAKEKGIRPPAYLLHDYKEGDKVLIKINSAYQKGMPHRRYHGKIATVAGSRGRAYVLKVRNMGKVKDIIVRPEHMVPRGGR